MKFIHIIILIVLVGCASGVADQPIRTTTPLNSGVGANEVDLFEMIAEQAFMIEALQAEIIALQEGDINYGYTYEVQEGQSLWLIAGDVLGDPYKWVAIYTMNYWMDDPNLIYPYQILLLP
jgi:nucleoid-associated protein YgaU